MSSTAILETPPDLSLIQPADIILTASESRGSMGIRGSTCSPFSHAILALEDGDCIDAMPGDGVRLRFLSDVLKTASHAVLYRHIYMTPEYAAYVCHFAMMQKNKEYDYFGAARSGISSGCGNGLPAKLPLFREVVIIHDSTQKRKHNNKFFCSELIVSSFDKADIPLLDIPAHAATPGAIATSNKLKIIKELIPA